MILSSPAGQKLDFDGMLGRPRNDIYPGKWRGLPAG